VAIVGIGQTAYGKALPGTAWELAIEAILAALADAGVSPADVDGMCRFAPPFEPVSEPMLVRALGIPELRFYAETPLGAAGLGAVGGSGGGGEGVGAVIGHAAAAVMTGQARVVVVYRALSQSKGGLFGRADRGGPSGSEAADSVPTRAATPGPPAADVVVPE